MDSKKKVISIVAIGVLVVLLVIDNMYSMLNEKKQEIEEIKEAKSNTLSKYKSAITRSKDLAKDKEEIEKKAKEISTYIIKAETDALAAAQMQTAIKQIIKAYGGNVRRMNVKKTEKMPPYQIVIIDVDASIPNITVLNDIVYDIEIKKPVLVMKNLDIKIVNYANPVVLSVNFDISGLTKMKM